MLLFVYFNDDNKVCQNTQLFISNFDLRIKKMCNQPNNIKVQEDASLML